MPRKRPTYPSRVLQFGGGNFLRGFAEWIIDILNDEANFAGGVIIVKPTRNGDYTKLREQQGNYHIITRGIKNKKIVSETHLVHCINKIIHPYNEWSEYLETAKLSEIRFIISNTTESGIKFNNSTYNINECPEEFPAKLTHWLHQRWQYFNGAKNAGCIILPCELINNNASHLKNCILKYIESWELGENFKEWILNSNHFYNTLVDRIVPGFPENKEEYNLSFDDSLVVMTEPYHLWVIEAPPDTIEELPIHKTSLNIILTEDLSRFRLMKIRILNGAHTAMVPISYIFQIETVKSAIEDRRVGNFITDLIFQEIIPTLDISENQLKIYSDEIIERFKNPFIEHKIQSIALNSISKFRHRLLPSLLEYVRRYHKLPEHIITVLSALILIYRGTFKSRKMMLRDESEIISFFSENWSRWEQDENTSLLITDILRNKKLWGEDLNLIDGLSISVKQKMEEFITID